MGILDRLGLRRPAENGASAPHRGRAQDAPLNRSILAQPPNVYGYAKGGLANLALGLGAPGDASSQGTYYRTDYTSRDRLDTLYAECWLLAKAVSIPAADMTTRWRVWDRSTEEDTTEARESDESLIQDIERAEREFGTRDFIRRLVIAGRLYGSAMGVMLDGTDPASELDPSSVGAGKLNVPIVDRFQMSIESWYADPLEPDFGRPALYRWTPEFVYGDQRRDGFRQEAAQIDVHPSRILRYDGIRLPVDTPAAYESWGIPLPNHVLTAILQEEQASAAASHLAENASIPIYRGDYKDALLSGDGAATAEATARDVASQMSVWRAIFLDATVEPSRLQVSFGGLEGILDRLAIRVAAAADIPVTRFYGRSPAGMNATGESDAANYAQNVAEMQESIRPLLTRLDVAVARHAGISGELPNYEWASLVESSDADVAMAAKTKAEALDIAVTASAISTDEMRASLDGDEIFGDLPGDAPEPEPDPLMAGMEANPPFGPGAEGEAEEDGEAQ